MIKSFAEFINEKSHIQVGTRNENMLFPDLDELKFDIGDKSTKNAVVISLVESEEGAVIFDVDKIKNDYYEFVDVYALADSTTGKSIEPEVYIVFGNETNGYEYETLSEEDFVQKYKK